MHLSIIQSNKLKNLIKYRGFSIYFGSLNEGKILDLNFFPGQRDYS